MPRGRLAALRTLPRSLLAVAAVRIGLTRRGLTEVRSRMLSAEPPVRQDLVEAGRLAWGVRTVSWIVPFASCLTQAQACQILLAREGIASTLCLGVRTGRRGRIEAHAWLRIGSLLVLGNDTENVSSFRLLSELGPTSR